MKNKYLSLVNDILVFTIALALAKIIQFLLMPMYTSHMSADVYGLAELINSLSEFLYPVVTLCVYEVAFRFSVDIKYDKKIVVNFLIKVLLLSMVIGVIIATILQNNYEFIWTFYIILYSYAIRICLAYYTRGCGLTKAFALNGILNALFLAIFSYINIVILKEEASGYLYAIAMANIVSIIYLFKVSGIYKLIDWNYKLKNTKELIKYAVPLIPYNVLYGITTLAGRYILNFYTDNHEVGIYVAAIKISAIVNMLQTAVYSAFQLNSSQNFYEKNKEDYYINVINIGIAMYCVFGAFVVCFYDLIGSITLKNEFSEGIVYLPIILFSAIINCISSIVGTMYTTYKKTNRMIPISVIGAAINVILGILFVSKLRIWGICIASCVTYLIQTIYKVIDVRIKFGLSINIISCIVNLVLLLLVIIVNSLGLNIIYRAITMFFLIVYNFIANKKQIENMVSKIKFRYNK